MEPSFADLDMQGNAVVSGQDHTAAVEVDSQQRVVLQVDSSENKNPYYVHQPSNTPFMSDAHTARPSFCVTIPLAEKHLSKVDYVCTMNNAETWLYCKANIAVPFTFSYLGGCHTNMRILIRPEYVEEKYTGRPIERCANHMFSNKSKKLGDRFMRCEHSEATYLGAEDAFAVTIPLCKSTTLIFTCFNSCGGIDRRATRLIFLLQEPNGAILDSCWINFKVCANPTRDASKNVGKSEGSRSVGNNGPPLAVTEAPSPQYSGDKCTPVEVHIADPAKVRKVMWVLMNEKAFDRLMELENERSLQQNSLTTSAAALRGRSAAGPSRAGVTNELGNYLNL